MLTRRAIIRFLLQFRVCLKQVDVEAAITPDPDLWSQLQGAGVKLALVETWGGGTVQVNANIVAELQSARAAHLMTAVWCQPNFKHDGLYIARHCLDPNQ